MCLFIKQNYKIRQQHDFRQRDGQLRVGLLTMLTLWLTLCTCKTRKPQGTHTHTHKHTHTHSLCAVVVHSNFCVHKTRRVAKRNGKRNIQQNISPS